MSKYSHEKYKQEKHLISVQFSTEFLLLKVFFSVKITCFITALLI